MLHFIVILASFRLVRSSSQNNLNVRDEALLHKYNRSRLAAMATKPGPLSHFPWEAMGNYKYLLTLPFVAVALAGRDDPDNWAFHMCGIAAAR
jgi:hypothetical protein